MMRALVIAVLLLTGCNAFRTGYDPVPLNGQTAQVLDADDRECVLLVDVADRERRTGRNSNGGLIFLGSGAGTLAGGSTGGAAGVGAGIVLGMAGDLYPRVNRMHADYRECMRERGYTSGKEEYR